MDEQILFSERSQYSFWKPEPVPPKDATILPVELFSLGKLATVSEKLLDIPHMCGMPVAPWEGPAEQNLCLRWECDAGVVLKVRIEQGPPRPGEVLTIEARSKAPEKIFYRLYVQIYEQFGVTVLDEKRHEFLTPREFRSRMAG